MEAKFFSEIQKNMDVKTIKDFEKEVRTKIYNELETLRRLLFLITRLSCDFFQPIKFLHNILFVKYIILRQFIVKHKILRQFIVKHKIL